jgi:hypothetical protein
LESKCTVTPYRGFESRPLRHKPDAADPIYGNRLTDRLYVSLYNAVV